MFGWTMVAMLPTPNTYMHQHWLSCAILDVKIHFDSLCTYSLQVLQQLAYWSIGVTLVDALQVSSSIKVTACSNL